MAKFVPKGKLLVQLVLRKRNKSFLTYKREDYINNEEKRGGIILTKFLIAGSRGARVPNAYQFSIILCQWYQHIIIDYRNPLIYGFHHFGIFSEPLPLKK